MVYCAPKQPPHQVKSTPFPITITPAVIPNTSECTLRRATKGTFRWTYIKLDKYNKLQDDISKLMDVLYE